MCSWHENITDIRSIRGNRRIRRIERIRSMKRIRHIWGSTSLRRIRGIRSIRGAYEKNRGIWSIRGTICIGDIRSTTWGYYYLRVLEVRYALEALGVLKALGVVMALDASDVLEVAWLNYRACTDARLEISRVYTLRPFQATRNASKNTYLAFHPKATSQLTFSLALPC